MTVAEVVHFRFPHGEPRAKAHVLERRWQRIGPLGIPNIGFDFHTSFLDFF